VKALFCFFLLLLAFPFKAQAPAAVPIPEEPHHHLVLQNSFVRVFRVSVPAHDATLLHQHDVPYLYVALGPADFVNAVAGKPEAHLMMEDGQVGYSPGGFAHIARTDSGLVFNNVTVELMRPQGKPHNWCERVVPDQPADCVAFAHGGEKQVSLFRTDEIEVFLDTLDRGASLRWQAFSDALVVPLTNSQLRASHDKHSENLDSGQAVWIPSHPNHEGRKLAFKNRGKTISRFLLILFEDSTGTKNQ
jgi:hypothetical protein